MVIIHISHRFIFPQFIEHNLAECRQDLSDCRYELSECRDDLSHCRDDLSECRDEMKKMSEVMVNIWEEVKQLKAQNRPSTLRAQNIPKKKQTEVPHSCRVSALKLSIVQFQDRKSVV